MTEILRLLNKHGVAQKEVALQYACLIRSDFSNWATVNAAIANRWSKSGLIRVKTMAWSIVERMEK